MTTSAVVLQRLRALADPKHLEEMARCGINTRQALGVSIYELRRIAKELGSDHALAIELWQSGLHEARILASYVADPGRVTEALVERWVRDFDSWDVCDQVADFLARTPFRERKLIEWAERPEELVKRAAFAVIAHVAALDERVSDAELARLFPLIARAADDDRKYVKKAVSWALRNLGKRSRVLHRQALAVARALEAHETPAARWIASDALRELTSDKVQKRLAARAPAQRRRRPAR
jgi:3-methyladenine DNA glycosylase AlkD